MVAAMAAGTQVEAGSVTTPTPDATGVPATAAPSTAPGAAPVEIETTAASEETPTKAGGASATGGSTGGSGSRGSRYQTFRLRVPGSGSTALTPSWIVMAT